MAEEQIQEVAWPGVDGFESLTGTISHGIRPAAFVAQTIPEASDPLATGTLVIGDGIRRLVLRDCKLDNLTGRAGADGESYTMTILDRRWKWQTGAISGRYNQLDPRGKLVPWTIRSPKELAELCLKAAGERRYVLNLPKGLPRAAGKNLDRYLRLGEKLPQSFANPPVVWDHLPPMVALSQLAARFGCRVVWQPVSDRVYVGPVGVGAKLPAGPCEVIAPAVDSPETPVAVGVAGAPMRIQMRLLLEAVAEEWDGSYVPVNEVSYAPQGDGQVQVSTVTWDGVTANPSVKVYITYTPPGGGAEVRLDYQYSDAVSAAVKLQRIADSLAANPAAAALLGGSVAGDVLTLTGKPVGWSFGVAAETSAAAPDSLTAALSQEASLGGGDWSWCRPPNFRPVRATERLTYEEAVALARKSVYRCYRVTNIDPTNGNQGVKVPYYTNDVEKFLTRRQQLILQPTKVDQVRPQPRGKGGRIRGVPVNPKLNAVLGGVMPEFYNGYSRDQKAVVYGSVSRTLGSVAWDPAAVGLNTPRTEKVRVEFSVDPVEQLVVFAEAVYERLQVGGAAGAATGSTAAGATSPLSRVKFPRLLLETAVLVTHPETNELYRWRETLPTGGTAPTEWEIRDDVQVDVIGNYDAGDALINWEMPEIGEGRKRAEYYLNGMAAKYRITGGETRTYIGIYPWDLDGYCQQATYSLGPGGMTTTLSGNAEHSDVIPEYPQRQRDENLPPNKQAAEANRLEQAFRDRLIPRPPGDVR